MLIQMKESQLFMFALKKNGRIDTVKIRTILRDLPNIDEIIKNAVNYNNLMNSWAKGELDDIDIEGHIFK